MYKEVINEIDIFEKYLVLVKEFIENVIVERLDVFSEIFDLVRDNLFEYIYLELLYMDEKDKNYKDNIDLDF